MKKIWMMLLMVSAVFAFSACSDDDNKEPQNPVSITSMPKEAKIGEEFIINGTGFTTSGIILYLQDSEKERTKVEAEFSNAGATFAIPAVTPGTFEIILTQGGNEWSLGNIAIEMAVSPIITPSVPEEVVYVGHEVILGGTGYENTDAISLKQEEGEAIVISEVTVTASGLQFTLPKDFAAGEYTVTLVRGVQSWVLPGTLNVQKEKRIKSISVENGMGELSIEMSYDVNNLLISANVHIEGQGDHAYKFTYENNKITTEGQYITLEYTLANGRIIQSTACGAYDETEEYNLWEYDPNNYLSSIKNMANTYEYIEVPTISYNTEGNLEELYLTGINQYIYSYDENALDAVQGTLDIAWATHLVMMIGWGMGEDTGIGLLLNQSGNTSRKIATKVSFTGYDGLDHEYAINTKWTDNNTLVSTCDDEANFGTTTIVYEDVE